jgi:hypothetical protein
VGFAPEGISFLNSKFIANGIALVISPYLHRFINRNIGDEIPNICGRKIADDEVFIDSHSPRWK